MNSYYDEYVTIYTPNNNYNNVPLNTLNNNIQQETQSDYQIDNDVTENSAIRTYATYVIPTMLLLCVIVALWNVITPMGWHFNISDTNMYES